MAEGSSERRKTADRRKSGDRRKGGDRRAGYDRRAGKDRRRGGRRAEDKEISEHRKVERRINEYPMTDEELDFIKAVNDLHDALMEGTLPELRKARNVALDEMERYLQHHFESEEHFMDGIGYPDLPAHRKLHREFAARVAGRSTS